MNEIVLLFILTQNDSKCYKKFFKNDFYT